MAIAAMAHQLMGTYYFSLLSSLRLDFRCLNQNNLNFVGEIMLTSTNTFDDNEPDEFFSCKIDDVKIISSVLHCLSIKSGHGSSGGVRSSTSTSSKDTQCYVEATPDSLKFSVTTRSQTTLARVTLQSDLFDDYHCERDNIVYNSNDIHNNTTNNSNRNSNGNTNSNTSHSQLTSEPIHFVLNLNTLLECINLFGSSGNNPNDNIAASMSYDSKECIFKITLDESGSIQTVCNISALYGDESISVTRLLLSAFNRNTEEASMILNSEAIKESIQEVIETHNSSDILVQVIPPGGYVSSHIPLPQSTGGLILTASGVYGECEVAFPGDTDEVFISFQCNPSKITDDIGNEYDRGRGRGGNSGSRSSNEVSWIYKMEAFQLGMKAVVGAVAKETYLRINSEGIMNIQHQIETVKGVDTFVDFLMSSQIRTNDEDDEKNNINNKRNNDSRVYHNDHDDYDDYVGIDGGRVMTGGTEDSQSPSSRQQSHTFTSTQDSDILNGDVYTGGQRRKKIMTTQSTTD